MSKIGTYLRRKQHYNYVEDSVLELANKIYQGRLFTWYCGCSYTPTPSQISGKIKKISEC